MANLSPNALRHVERAEKLLARVKKEEWDNRTLHSMREVPLLAQIHMLLALASPQPFGKYSPDQPRDDHGRWTSGGNDESQTPANSPSAKEKQYADAGNFATDADADNTSNNFDIKGAVTHLNQAADQLKQTQTENGEPNKFGAGRCAHYVADAIEAGGDADAEARPSDAKDFSGWLENAGFVPVATANADSRNNYPPLGYTAKAGDVAVVQPYSGGNPSGHMAMYNGTQWVSDFRQNSFWASSYYRNYGPSFVIYRHSDNP